MKHFIYGLLALLSLASLPVYAQTRLPIQIEQLQLQQEQLGEIPANKTKRQLLQQIISVLQHQLQLREQIKALQNEISSQPDALAALNDAREEGYSDNPLSRPDTLDAEQLDHRITTFNAHLLELERDQALQQKQQLQVEQTQRNIQDQLTGLKLDREVGLPGDSTINLADFPELRQQLQDANFEESGLRIQALELELLALPKRAEIAKLIWQALEHERLYHTEILDQLRDVQQTRQRTEAEQALSSQEDNRKISAAHPILATAQEKNQLLSTQLRELLPRIETVNRQKLSLQKHLTVLNSTFRSISQQLELEVSHISPEQRQFIFKNKEPVDSRITSNEINLLRLQNSLLEQQQTEVTLQHSSLPADVTRELTPGNQALYLKLLNNRITLIKRIRDTRLQLITELNQVLNIETQINQQITNNSQLLSEQLLWNPVSKPISTQWPNDLLIASEQLVTRWNKKHTEPLFRPDENIVIRSLFFTIILMLLAWSFRYLYAHQQQWKQQIGHVIQDRFQHSVQALLLALIIAMPIPLMLLYISTSLLNPQYGHADTLAQIFRIAALATWTIQSLRNLLNTPYGLFAGHFGLNETLTRLLRRHLAALYFLGLPLLIIQLYLWDIDSEAIRSGPIRLSMIALILVIIVLWGSLWRLRDELNQLTDTNSWWSRAEVWLSGLIMFNLAMLGLTAAGYSFTVNVMMIAVVQILLVLLTAFIFYKLAMRWILIAERRLEFDRVKARRAEMIAAREKHEEEAPLETNYLNLQTISHHSRTLLKTATLVLLVFMLWLFMGGFLPFFSALDNIVLWSSFNTEGELINNVTLKNLLFGIIVLSLSLLAAYNLPGLLELLVLQNLNLQPGTGYAYSTLIKYLLIIVGILGAVSHFGLEWGRLQWLVAALGVGLGFGLQEIVANFVSGLIILFEKPVRIGDTVTIDNLTGTVTRIQIRATTIVDWDRKEVIIPNKTFITQQLINWSLTDSITRIVIPVGLAYGSDTELARRLLLESAREQTKVIKEPKPEAFFTGFGDSALNMELRLYVNAMSDRLEVTHLVNTCIASKFKAAGLEVAFPQLDVHLQSPPDISSQGY
ncbi:MAG: mechanosensitive ion channel domain-containing protein [Pontibacterium sp.]